LKRHKLPGSDEFRQNWFKQEVKYYVLRSISKLILFGIRKNCLISGWVYHSTRRAMKLAIVIIVGYHCYQLHTILYSISFSEG
jgi:hypothetical protein